MARFAQDCLSRFTYLVHKLELTLGPGKKEYSTQFRFDVQIRSKLTVNTFLGNFRNG